MKYNGERRLREALKKAKREAKSYRDALRHEFNKGYAEGYNKARAETAKVLRELACMDPL